jgi:hypothetical protein
LDVPESNTVRVIHNKSTSSEIKEKMEQQLKLQREAHNKKRAEELKCNLALIFFKFIHY